MASLCDLRAGVPGRRPVSGSATTPRESQALQYGRAVGESHETVGTRWSRQLVSVSVGVDCGLVVRMFHVNPTASRS